MDDIVFPNPSKETPQRIITRDLLQRLELSLDRATLVDLGARYSYRMVAHLLVKVSF